MVKKPAKKRSRRAKPSSAENSVSKRKVGRPRRLGPTALDEIGKLWLQGYSNIWIGEQYGVDESTIRHHLTNTIKPVLFEQCSQQVDVELLKIDLMERVAWERFESEEPGEIREKGIRGSTQRIRDLLEKHGVSEQLIERVTIRRIGSSAWLNVVQWCIEQRCKIRGYYAAERHDFNINLGIRAAGKSPDELDHEMLEKLALMLAKKQQIEEAKTLMLE